MRVGFWLPVLNTAGGTEIWHETLFRELVAYNDIELVGAAVNDIWMSNAMANRLRRYCPVWLGSQALRELACKVDILIVWGLANLAPLLPVTHRPYVIMVCHGDENSAWTVNCMASAEEHVDKYVAVANAAVPAIPARRRNDAVIIENGISIDRIRPTRTRREMRDEWGVDINDRVLLSVCRLSQEKDPLRIVQAVPAGWKLVMAGTGPLYDTVVSSGRAIMLGDVEAVGNLYNASDVFVSCSTTEGFGLSIAEAATAGMPVVTMNVGIVRDHPGDFNIIDSGKPIEHLIRRAVAHQFCYYNSLEFGLQWRELLLAVSRAY